MSMFSKPNGAPAKKDMTREKVPLIQLADLGQIDAMRELLECKQIPLDVNEQDENGNFAAMVATERNNLPMLKLLVSHGAHLNVQDGLGRTVLNVAEKLGKFPIIEFIKAHLVQQGEASQHCNSLSLSLQGLGK